MRKTKSTKRALLLSVLALLSCVAMLVGSTFAWFTDEVTSGRNVIAAGNLDIELLADGQPVDAATVLFDNSLWEPGVVVYENLEVANVGSLALTYELRLNAIAENNLEGHSLSEVVKIAVLDETIAADATRADVLAKAKDAEPCALADFAVTGDLLAGKADALAIVIFWDPNDNATDNLYNVNNGKQTSDGQPLYIDFGIELVATQLMHEEDSFGNDYDEGLTPPDEDGDILVEKDGIQYVYTADGSYKLYLVTEAYVGDTVVVPEGVDTIGNYAFTYNDNVKTVILSSSVKSLGRGFDSSSVEKVVLNEGLEQIDSRAFRSTANLKEVVISSTVKTIADNAFQKSGIQTITIPATVETVGEAAFGASKIETVIFEGNTSVQGYAFRGCPALRTVIMKGDDNTFIPSTLNGRNSMWFCNGESNNPNTSNIDFYVENDTVAARVKTAMGAEANNTDVFVKNAVSSADDLKAALANDDKYIALSGDVAFTGVAQYPDRNNYVEVYGNKVGFAQYGGVLDGNGNALIDNEGDRAYVFVTHGGTVKNLTITTGARGIVTYSPTENVYVDNVIVDGPGYALNSAEQTAVDMVVANSTVNGWTSLAGFNSVSLTNCKLGENSSKYWQSMGYSQDYDRLFRVYSPTSFTACEFEQGYYLDLSAGGTATLVDCTVNGVEITAENYADYITIELASGKTLAESVTFG